MSDALPVSALPPLGSLPLARAAVDRGCEERTDPGLFDRIWGSPETRVMFISSGTTPVADNALVFADSSAVERPANPVYLGRSDDGGVHYVLSELHPADVPVPEHTEWLGLRDVAARLSPRDAGLFVQAAAISNWHATHTHCPRCGEPTVPEDGGWVRRCPADKSQHFPRTDPAIIVAVTDAQDRLLLGSSASWPENRFSTLAGFVEPGESLEAAVVREVAEEAGIRVHSPEYLGSQPWPFPASLMLGFTACADTTELVPDGVEIREVRWFTRDGLAGALRSGDITVAGGVSIARALIEHWYGAPLDEAPSQGRP